MKEEKLKLRFKFREDLIYYTSYDDERERLCISEIMNKKIFQLVHDRQSYENFHRFYDRIVSLIYIRYF